MSIDTSKKISTITYNDVAIPMKMPKIETCTVTFRNYMSGNQTATYPTAEGEMQTTTLQYDKIVTITMAKNCVLYLSGSYWNIGDDNAKSFGTDYSQSSGVSKIMVKGNTAITRRDE